MYKIKTLQLSILSFFFLLTASITTTHAQTNSSEDLKKTINDTYGQLTQYMKDNKPAELAKTLYTKDAKFYPPNGMVVEGTKGVTKAFTGLIGEGLIIDPEAQEVEIYGNHAYEYGIGTIYNKDGQVVRKSRYVCIWKNVNNEWKIHRDFVQGIEIK